jgi:hypothetical protein
MKYENIEFVSFLKAEIYIKEALS